VSAASTWADERLAQALELVEAVSLDAHEAGLFVVVNALKRAETAIENADIALEEERAA
jgi:hypothetical protein